MRVRITCRGGLAGLIAVAALLVGAAPASAAPGDASAYGAKLNLTLLNSPAVTAGPFAAADANGSAKNTNARVDLTGVLRTGAINTSASRDDKTGGVYSRASTADVRVDLLHGITGTITAELVEAECQATQKGVTGRSTLAKVNLGELGKVDAAPAPNTKLTVRLAEIAIAEVIFNEQIRNSDGSLTVNAVHVKLLQGKLGSVGTGDLIVSSATCGPAGLPIPMASGAGLWIGLGLLGVAAAPVAAVAIRNRRAV